MAHQDRGDETRNRILTAAAECFTRAGYDATGVAEICARAGVSKGAFYHHFPSKQALFLVLVEQWLQGVDAPLRATRGAHETARGQLIGLAQAVKPVFARAGGQIPMFLEFWRQAAKDPQVWQATIEPYRRFRAAFAGLIRDGIADGSLRPADPDVAALAIVSLGVGLVVQAALDPAGEDWGRAAEAALRLLLEGLVE
ncbi:MAG: TetR/AcrR family transcriptional regulator [Anaerolineae bacterium]